MVTIEYIDNTCDYEGLEDFGEILVLVKDGVPVSHLDYSDTVLELDRIPELLKPFVDIEVKMIDKPSKKLLKAVKEYLQQYY